MSAQFTTPPTAVEALRELVKTAHEGLCFNRVSRTAVSDPMASVSGIGLKVTPDPEYDAAIARLNAAWDAARRAALAAPAAEPAGETVRIDGFSCAKCGCVEVVRNDSSAPTAEPAQSPKEFWDLLHEWKTSMNEERIEYIERRFDELFALAAAKAGAA